MYCTDHVISIFQKHIIRTVKFSWFPELIIGIAWNTTVDEHKKLKYCCSHHANQVLLKNLNRMKHKNLINDLMNNNKQLNKNLKKN